MAHTGFLRGLMAMVVVLRLLVRSSRRRRRMRRLVRGHLRGGGSGGHGCGGGCGGAVAGGSIIMGRRRPRRPGGGLIRDSRGRIQGVEGRGFASPMSGGRGSCSLALLPANGLSRERRTRRRFPVGANDHPRRDEDRLGHQVIQRWLQHWPWPGSRRRLPSTTPSAKRAARRARHHLLPCGGV